jgi:hypothetical protein
MAQKSNDHGGGGSGNLARTWFARESARERAKRALPQVLTC